MLGLDIDLDHILSKKDYSREKDLLNSHKKAVEEGEALELKNK